MRSALGARKDARRTNGHTPGNREEGMSSCLARTNTRKSDEGGKALSGSGTEQDSAELFDFEITDELRALAAGYETLGDSVRAGDIPNSLLADLAFTMKDHPQPDTHDPASNDSNSAETPGATDR